MSDKQSTIKQSWESANDSSYMSSSRQGLDEALVRQISESKNEPVWMLEHRLHSLSLYNQMSMPAWGPDLSLLDFF